ncbi:outer membrane protein assembly factor BamB family protein [Actinocorallia populi]|uniref:outer membrane protein assembly factor BamB family protein n=1 Tax=Actinocorallia populi TaxID=2079200 RepID=UPI000D094836|nr:PQQ-binding-like beta-propeller repeat protein [Actinocorallia populi]
MKWILLAVLGLLRGLAAAFLVAGLWAYGSDGEGAWLGIVGLVLLILVKLVGVPESGRPGAVLVGSAVAGLGLGYVVHDVLQDERLERAWTVEADSPNTLKPKGHWSISDTLVRVRSDGAFAHDLRDGKRRWAYELPRPQVVCATSGSADGGVGLIAYTADGAGCDHVAALDLASGRVLWERTVEGRSDGQGGLETGSGVAAVAAASGLKVFDLRTGTPRRSLRTPAGCSFSSVAVGGGRVAATYVCAQDSSRLGVVELGGRDRWSTNLGTSGPVEGLALLSAEPLVVHVQEAGDRGKKELLVFDPVSGERRSAIPADTLDPAFPVIVEKDRIHTVIDRPGTEVYQNDLVSHPLTGGKPWSVHFEDGVKAVRLTGSGLFALSEPGVSEHLDLTTLDPRSGAETRRVEIGHAAPAGWRPDLLVTADRVLFVLRDPSNETDPEILAFATGEE